MKKNRTSVSRRRCAVVAAGQNWIEVEGHELHPEVRPRIISDNGPQFIAKDLKEFVRISGMRHVRSSPYYPQFTEMERWHKSQQRGYCQSAVGEVDDLRIAENNRPSMLILNLQRKRLMIKRLGR